MLKYTGHPLYDIGVATITAFARKRDPSELTAEDLAEIADYMAAQYTQYPLKSFLTVVFPNSGFTQPAFDKTPERRTAYAQQVLRSYGDDVETLKEQCVFTGEPATAVVFRDSAGDMPPGRAFRQHIPMLTGEGVINFHPNGDAGIPVSGKAMLAIQAFPLGCAKAGGRVLGVHSDNPRMMRHFAQRFLEGNLQKIQITQQKSSVEERKKMPDAEFEHRTLLIKTLLDADVMRQEAQADDEPFSLSAYHLSNSGQGPGLNIYHVTMPIIDFLRTVAQSRYRDKWQALVARGWQQKPKPKKGNEEAIANFQPRYNRVYEDILALPQGATKFIRTYFLRIALRVVRSEDDPRQSYALRQEIDLVSWDLTALFLRKVVRMDPERIERIRIVGDRLAAYVKKNNHKKFFRNFSTAQKYFQFRIWLLNANQEAVRDTAQPLVTLDDYLWQ